MERPEATEERPAAAAPTRLPWGRGDWLLLALVLLAGLVLRVYRLDAHGLWLDELLSISASTGRYPDVRPLLTNEITPAWPDFSGLDDARPWWHVWTSMREETHPPLYMTALRAWREAFGESDVAARMLSVVASIVACGLLFAAGREVGGRHVGFWAAALMVVAGPQGEYGREVRPYAMLLALGVGAMLAVLRVERHGPNRRRTLALGACALAMAFTHYFAAGALLAVGTYALLRLRGRARRGAVLSLSAAAVVFLAAWGPTVWRQRAQANPEFLRDRGPLVTKLWRLDGTPQRLLVETHELGDVPFVGVVAFLLPLPFLRRRPELLLPYLWFACTIGLVATLDLTRGTKHLKFIRYSLLAAPGFYLLAAGLTSRWRGLYAHLLPALLAWYCVANLPAHYQARANSWREPARFTAAHAAEGELIVFASPSAPVARALCMGFSHYAHDPRRAVLVLDGPPPAHVREALGRRGSAWFVGFEDYPHRFFGDDVRFERAAGVDGGWVLGRVRFQVASGVATK